MTEPHNTTFGGYDVYEVLSALQKCVRRGLEEDALYWATEMLLSDGIGESKTFAGRLWSRILVMASEDVGLASDAASSANVLVACEALYRNWKKFPANKLWAMHATLILVRAPKSRITDNAYLYFYAQEKLGKRKRKPIPDWALDKHTVRGRAMGRGQMHFFDVGTHLNNQPLEDPYRDLARELMLEAERKGKL